MAEPNIKAVYSEASYRAIDHALELLAKSLGEERVAPLRALLAEARIHEVDLFVKALTGPQK